MTSNGGFAPNEGPLNPSQCRVWNSFVDLLKMEREYDDDFQTIHNAQQDLTSRKKKLLACREKLIRVKCSSLDSEIGNVDTQVQKVDENFRLLKEQTKQLKDHIRLELISYAKEFVSSDDVKGPIVDIFNKYGITSLDSASSSISPPKNVVAAKFDFLPPVDTVNKHQLNTQDHHRILRLLVNLLKIGRNFDVEVKKLKDMRQVLVYQETSLMNNKYIAADTIHHRLLKTYIVSTDEKLKKIKESNDMVEQLSQNLRKRIQAELIEYSEKFISSADLVAPISTIFQQYDISSCDLANSWKSCLLTRLATEQHDTPDNNDLNCQKNLKTHQDALLEIIKAHLEKFQPYLDKQQSLLVHMTELQTDRHKNSKGPLADIEVISRKMEDAQNELTESYEQLKMANENMKMEMERYVTQYMDDKNITKNVLQLLSHNFLTNAEIMFQPEPTDEPMPDILVQVVAKVFECPDNDIEMLCNESAENMGNQVFKALMDQIEDLEVLIEGENDLVETCSTYTSNIPKVSELIEKSRRDFAEKYLAPRERDNFVHFGDLPTLLAELTAHADVKFFDNKLQHLPENSKKLDRSISSISSTSSSDHSSSFADIFASRKTLLQEKSQKKQ